MARHADSLPPIFAQYADRVEFVRRVSEREYSSTCPKCGGTQHPDRSWPDRCRWFLDGKPLGWCRQCHGLFWPDQAPGWQPPTPAELETWRERQEEQQRRRQETAQKALAWLQSNKPWLAYHEALDDFARAYWHRRGLADFWLDYWQLGWRRDWGFHQQDGYVHRTASAAIPLLMHDGSCVNVKHRLIDPPPDAPNMRYLYEIKDQEEPPFICNREVPLAGHVIAVEGEIKAMVCFATLDDGQAVMVGLPGTNPAPEILDQLRAADRVTLIMDPGAGRQLAALARAIGVRKCRGLIPSMKIDDGILASKLDSHGLQRYLESAFPVGAYVTGGGN